MLLPSSTVSVCDKLSFSNVINFVAAVTLEHKAKHVLKSLLENADSLLGSFNTSKIGEQCFSLYDAKC